MAQLDLTQSGPPAANPVSAETANALNQWKNDLGSNFAAERDSLNTALSGLADALTAAIADKTDQLAKIDANKAFLDTVTIKTPTVKPSNLPGVIKTLFTSLNAIKTDDVHTINLGAQNASKVRDPQGLSNFLNKSISIKRDLTEQEINEMRNQLKTVNGFKNQLNSL